MTFRSMLFSFQRPKPEGSHSDERGGRYCLPHSMPSSSFLELPVQHAVDASGLATPKREAVYEPGAASRQLKKPQCAHRLEGLSRAVESRLRGNSAAGFAGSPCPPWPARVRPIGTCPHHAQSPAQRWPAWSLWCVPRNDRSTNGRNQEHVGNPGDVVVC